MVKGRLVVTLPIAASSPIILDIPWSGYGIRSETNVFSRRRCASSLGDQFDLFPMPLQSGLALARSEHLDRLCAS